MTDVSGGSPDEFRCDSDTPVEDIRQAIMGPGPLPVLSDADLMVASEVAYKAADFALAALSMELLSDRYPQDAGYRLRLATFYHLQGESAAAERAYNAALDLDCTLENAYHGLRELRLTSGDAEGALAIAIRQRELCGSSDELTLVIGEIYRRCGAFREALAAFQSVPERSPCHLAAINAEAVTAYEMGQLDHALSAARHLCRVDPDNHAHRLLCVNILCADRRFDEALPLLQLLLGEDDESAELHSIAASALAETGRYHEALTHAERACELDPYVAEFWYQAAILANVLGFRDEALERMNQAVSLGPANSGLLIAHAHLLNGLGRVSEAIEHLAHAGERFPRDTQIRDLRVLLLSTEPGKEGRVEALSGSFKPLPRSTARSSRAPHKGGGDFADFLEGIRIQARVILALAVRELSHRTARSKFGVISAIIEPLLQILMLGLVLSIFNNGQSPLGKSLFFFYATGVLPFYMFLHVIGHCLGQLSEGVSLLQVPRIRRIDLIFAMGLAELLIGSMTTILVFTLFFSLGYGEGLDNIINAVIGYFMVWVFSLGVALIFAVLNTITTTIESVWQTLQRFLYFLSGIFFIPQYMPAWARDILVWNPLLVGIEWFRTGMFQQYDPPWVSKVYMVSISAATVVVGVALERAARRQARTH